MKLEKAINASKNNIEVWTKAVYNEMELKGYEVSNFGNVRSYLKQKIVRKGNEFAGSFTFIDKNPKLKKLGKTKGYKQVRCSVGDIEKGIFKNTGSKIFAVHKLVFDSFVPIKENPPCNIPKEIWDSTDPLVKSVLVECIEVNHKNHNKDDCNLLNLERTTPKGNARSLIERYGSAQNKKIIEKNKEFALTDPDGKLHIGRNLTKFCIEHNLDRRSIQKVLKGESKSHKGWKRANQYYVNNAIQHIN